MYSRTSGRYGRAGNGTRVAHGSEGAVMDDAHVWLLSVIAAAYATVLVLWLVVYHAGEWRMDE